MKINNQVILWLAAGLLLVFLFSNLQSGPGDRVSEITYSDFLAQVEDGRVQEVTIQGQNIVGQLGDGTQFRTFAPSGTDLVAPLKENGVGIKAAP